MFWENNMTDSNITFIGLGNMGGPMAQNLQKAGFALTVFDLVPATVKTLTDLGAKSAATIAEAVKNADIIITMLPADKHMRSVYLNADGVIAHAKKTALLIDSSTISAALAREVGTEAEKKGISFIDAPVSGGTAAAAAGTLTFIVGGKVENMERAKTVLEKMGKAVLHAGPTGAGQVAKICNNMLLAVHMIGSCEALNLGAKHGLDAKILSDILMKSSGRNWSLEVYNPMPGVMDKVPASRGYSGGFGTDLMIKDLGLAMESASAVSASTPLGALARQLYQLHSQAGNGKTDFSGIFQMIAAK
jgi:3-hydroxyisobutyrate dehydrogenase